MNGRPTIAGGRQQSAPPLLSALNPIRPTNNFSIFSARREASQRSSLTTTQLRLIVIALPLPFSALFERLLAFYPPRCPRERGLFIRAANTASAHPALRKTPGQFQEHFFLRHFNQLFLSFSTSP
jgi:hypothetical protein